MPESRPIVQTHHPIARRQILAMYRLTVPAAIPNFQPSFNVCPTDPVDVIVPNEGARELANMRWGLVPYWWSKPLKAIETGHVQCASRDGN